MWRDFASALAVVQVASTRRPPSEHFGDPWGVLSEMERIKSEVARGLLAIEDVLASLRSAANEQVEFAFDMTLSETRWAVEHNRQRVFREMRVGYTSYQEECARLLARPVGWTAWVGEAWGGDRRRGDDDIKIACEEPVDQRQRGPRLLGRPVSASHLADQYRQLAISSPRDLPPPPTRGPQNVTGGGWPKGIFSTVESWACDSSGQQVCQSPWQPDVLDSWLRTAFGDISTRFGRAISAITDQVFNQLGIGEQLVFLRKAKRTSGPEWSNAITIAMNQLQDRYDFMPTPYRAPSYWGWVCPEWRRCGGLLRPYAINTDLTGGNP